MLTYIAVVATLSLVVSCADLVLDWRATAPVRGHELDRKLAREGVTLAEATGGTHQVKQINAVNYVLDQAKEQKRRMTGATARKLVEVALEETKQR